MTTTLQKERTCRFSWEAKSCFKCIVALPPYR